MKVIVFGGLGFLGSHIVESLGAQGHNVTIFDLRKPELNEIEHKMVIGDVTIPELVNKAVSGCEVVYNLAGMADIDDCINRPLDAVKYNILGNTVILDACVKAKVKRFVYASTVYVYSDAGGIYRSTKQACELIIENYYKYYGLNYTILRYGTLYGPNADERNSVFNYLKQACGQKKIRYRGSGNEIREYIHASDAARLSVNILSEEYENQRVLIAGHQPTRVSDLFVMINEILGGDIGIEYLSEDSELQETHYNITPYSYNPKIAKKLVNHHYLDLGQGILDCIERIKEMEKVTL